MSPYYKETRISTIEDANHYADALGRLVDNQDGHESMMIRTLEEITAELTALKAQARRYDAGIHESGEGYNPFAEATRKLEREYDRVAEATAAARVAAIRQAEEAEWTLELTQRRRAEWNAWVKAQGKTIHTAQVAAQIARQGWSVEALKAAITRHGL